MGVKNTHGQDVGELGVAEVGDDLGCGRGHDGGQAEGAHGPAEVGLPPGALQGQTLAQGWLVHLCSDATSACSDLPLELLASGSPLPGASRRPAGSFKIPHGGRQVPTLQQPLKGPVRGTWPAYT